MPLSAREAELKFTLAADICKEKQAYLANLRRLYDTALGWVRKIA